MERGDIVEAEKKLEEAVKLNRKDVTHRRNYAEALWQRNKYQEALEQLNEAVRRGGQNDASLHISLAEKYLAIQQPDTAYRHAEIAVRLTPQAERAWAVRARANGQLAERQPEPQKRELLLQSRNDYYRVLSLSANNREILPELAAIQMLCGQPEQALATWQSLQEHFPKGTEPADLFRGKAETYIALRRFQEARDCLETVRQREPEHFEVERRIQDIAAMSQSPLY